MNHVAATLGVPLPFTTARAAVMNNSLKRSRSEQGLFLSHRDSLLKAKATAALRKELRCNGSKLGKQLESYLDDDNHTLGTVSSCDTDSFSSTCSSMSTVSFAPSVVSEVRYRPRTSPEEKSDLFYTEAEYRQFRRDFLTGRRGRLVKFSARIVTNVFTYPDPAASADSKDAMFYSEADLQRFLDEFVSSLNGTSV